MTALVQLADIVVDDVERTDVPFGEWLPDLPELNNPGAVEALNVLPIEGGYSPFPSLSTSTVLPEVVRGATSVISPADITQIYAGTIAGIYTKFGGGGFTKLISKNSNIINSWKFIRVNEQMVMIHPEHDPMRSPVATTTPPVVLGGTPPRAACGAQVGDFLFLGDLLIDPDDSGGRFPSRIRWSGFNNIDMPWISDPITQADFQDMPAEGGPIVAIAGREHGTIFQARMISRATYRGPPTIFDIATLEDKRGAIARDCVVDIGPLQYFIAEDGFFYWNGTNSVPIGDSRVNRYFFNKLQYSFRNRIVGAADFVNGCVHWAFPTGSSGELDEIITYSYRENRFAHTQIPLEYLFSSAVSNISAEELTNPAESYTVSFDSPQYRAGGRMRLAAFDTAHTYGLFVGPNMAAAIDTSEFTGPDGRRVFINHARPLVDINAPVAQMRVLKRDQLIGGPLELGNAIWQEADGTFSIFGDARYMRFRVIIPAGAAWTHGNGVQISRKATGVF